ncbi:MAG: VWA domain-containing protein [Acidobacteriaceae bacterium]|nr:VWA domain-containing protein [Acidobacteriaceae bacterium]
MSYFWVSLAMMLTVVGRHSSQAQSARGVVSASPSTLRQTAVRQEQQPEYTLSVSSQLVTLDVVVNDKSGQPVRGLKRSDFTVYEDNVPQPIVSFEAAEPKRPTGRGPTEIHSTAELDRLQPDAPVTIVVLDEVTTKFEDQYFARYSLEKYLSKQGAILDQPLMLMAKSLDHQQVLHDYTTSKKEILDALNHHLAGNDWRTTNSSWSSEQILAEFTSLIEIAKATQGHAGHKSLIWVGRGFPSVQRDDVVPGQKDPLGAAIAQCTNLLRDARVTLYMIDPAGVAAPSATLDVNGTMTIDDPFGGQVGFEQMAAATGGQSLHGRNDVDRLIGTTVSDGQIFYSIAYKPESVITTDNPWEFRKIRVVLRDGALVATTREGYYVAKPDVPAVMNESGQLSQQARFNLAAASQGLMVFDGIPLTISRDQTTPDRFQLAFPAASLNLRDDGSKMIGNVSLIVLSFDRTGKLLNRSGQVISLHLARLQSGETESRTVQIATSLDTRSPAARVRFIVLGDSNGKVGADNFFLVDRNTLKDSATGLKPSGARPK